MRALKAEAALQCKNLDKITDAEELVAALKQQYKVDAPSASIRLRKGPAGTQITTINLPVGEVNPATAVGKVKVGWSVFRGRKFWACKGLSRSKLCRKYGVEGHIARNPSKGG